VTKVYYFDTAIWIDIFENRDEPNLPKGRWANELLNKIVKEDNKIIYSDNSLIELKLIGYPIFDIKNIFKPFKPILIFVESTKKEIGKAKDLSLKRNIPKRDALHALIARDNRAILVTLDEHYKKLKDIIETKRPQDLI